MSIMKSKLTLCAAVLMCLVVTLSSCGYKSELKKIYISDNNKFQLRFQEDGSFVANGLTFPWNDHYINGNYELNSKSLTLYPKSLEASYFFTVNREYFTHNSVKIFCKKFGVLVTTHN